MSSQLHHPVRPVLRSGAESDPVTSREHVLIANLLDAAWRKKKNLTLADLLRSIQKPPFQKLGGLELESFFPSTERFGLAARLNQLLASPAFSSAAEASAPSLTT